MKKHVAILAAPLGTALLWFAVCPWLNGQITNQIRAHISHDFVIGKKTLPPGDYTFTMHHNAEASMTVTNDNDKKSLEFIVGSTVDNHLPHHAELVFRKYGNTEFLSKIFQPGEKIGVELTESKSREAKLAQTIAVTEHTEEGQ